jgi:hypothetical protein
MMIITTGAKYFTLKTQRGFSLKRAFPEAISFSAFLTFQT